MPTLELLIDATGMQRGAAVAKTALDSVTATAAKTATEVQRSGSALSSAFQVTGGGVQIATGISQTAKAFGELNTAAGLFNASRTLLEVGNTARDFQQLRGAVGGAATVFGTLGAVIRANPIGAVATAIGIAATAFAAFSSGAKQAAVDYQALADEIRKNDISDRANRLLGIPDDPAARSGRQLRQIQQLQQGLVAGQGLPGGFNQLRDAAGLSDQQLIAFLAFEGNQSAAQFLSRGSFADSRTVSGGPGGFPRIENFENTSPGAVRLTNEQALAVLRSQAQSLLRQTGQVSTPEALGPFARNVSDSALYSTGVLRPGFNANPSIEDILNPDNGVPGSGVRMTEEQMQQQAERWERINENIERATRAGEQFGAAIGGALFDAISGANTLRGALAAVFQSLARQGFQEGVGGLFGAVVGGITGTQRVQNSGIPQVGGPGITTS
jgi:hypothetical protein